MTLRKLQWLRCKKGQRKQIKSLTCKQTDTNIDVYIIYITSILGTSKHKQNQNVGPQWHVSQEEMVRGEAYSSVWGDMGKE